MGQTCPKFERVWILLFSTSLMRLFPLHFPFEFVSRPRESSHYHFVVGSSTALHAWSKCLWEQHVVASTQMTLRNSNHGRHFSAQYSSYPKALGSRQVEVADFQQWVDAFYLFFRRVAQPFILLSFSLHATAWYGHFLGAALNVIANGCTFS